MLTLLFSLIVLAGTVTATQTGVFPVPMETIQPPANISFGVQVDQIGTKIITTFRGGFGQNILKNIEISVISPDGTKQTQDLGLKIGDSLTFSGTGCGDQVTGTAIYMSGFMYPFLNQMMEYQNSFCPVAHVEYVDPCEIIAASPSLKPDPIMEIPANRSVAIQANVDIRTIVVEFRGGFGQNLIRTIEVTKYSPDGTKEMKELDKRTGSSVSFKASNGCMERIAAEVTFIDGTKYHFFDKVLHVSRTH
jgi:hypothetical protein